MYTYLDNSLSIFHESGSLIIFPTLSRLSFIGLRLSNNNKAIIFKFFDFFSPKLSTLYLRIRVMVLLRLFFRLFGSILRFVLSLLVAFFSFFIIASFVFSLIVSIMTLIFVSTFSFIGVWSLMLLIWSLSLGWTTLSLIIRLCFTWRTLCWLNLFLNLFGFNNFWDNLGWLNSCSWLDRSWYDLCLYLSFREILYFNYFWFLLQNSIYDLFFMRNLRWDCIVSVFLNEIIQGLL